MLIRRLIWAAALFLPFIVSAKPVISVVNPCVAVLSDDPFVAASLPAVRGFHFAGVDQERFEYFAEPSTYGRQRLSNWCWAACSQMVSHYYGLPIPQELFVEKMNGALVNNSETMPAIVHALSGWVTERNGQRLVSEGVFVKTDALSLLEILREGRPVIVGLNLSNGGHAVLMTGMTYDFDPIRSVLVPRTVIIRNPWTGSPSREELTWAEFLEKRSGQFGATLNLILR